MNAYIVEITDDNYHAILAQWPPDLDNIRNFRIHKSYSIINGGTICKTSHGIFYCEKLMPCILDEKEFTRVTKTIKGE